MRETTFVRLQKYSYVNGKSSGKLPLFSSWITVRKGGSLSKLPDATLQEATNTPDYPKNHPPKTAYFIPPSLKTQKVQRMFFVSGLQPYHVFPYGPEMGLSSNSLIMGITYTSSILESLRCTEVANMYDIIYNTKRLPIIFMPNFEMEKRKG